MGCGYEISNVSNFFPYETSTLMIRSGIDNAQSSSLGPRSVQITREDE